MTEGIYSIKEHKINIGSVNQAHKQNAKGAFFVTYTRTNVPC